MNLIIYVWPSVVLRRNFSLICILRSSVRSKVTRRKIPPQPPTSTWGKVRRKVRDGCFCELFPFFVRGVVKKTFNSFIRRRIFISSHKDLLRANKYCLTFYCTIVGWRRFHFDLSETPPTTWEIFPSFSRFNLLSFGFFNFVFQLNFGHVAVRRIRLTQDLIYFAYIESAKTVKKLPLWPRYEVLNTFPNRWFAP